MQPDSFVLTALSQDAFYRQHPIDFFMYDAEGNSNLYILNDNVPGKTHNLILVNESTKDDLTLVGNKNLPDASNYHFELRFRPGTLDPAFHNWITVGAGEWLIQSKLWGENNAEKVTPGTVSIYLLYQLDTQLTLPAHSSRLIPLHGLKSGSGGGSRGTRVELRYKSVRFQSGGKQAVQIVAGSILPENLITAGASPVTQHYRQERLEITNQRGVRNIPLKAGFATGNKVLNNNTEPNALHLQISNLLRNNFIPFQGKYSEAPSRLVLSFDTSEAPEYWALFDEDNAFGVEDIKVSGTDTFWHIEKEVQGQTVQWILSPSEPLELDAGESFQIQLNKILSGMPSGMANLYLSYENIPGYWDDLLVVPIEKTPFYLEDKQDEKQNTIKTVVGLGTHQVDPDGAALQITGGLSVDGLLISAAALSSIPRGGIIMWSGAETNVPEGWNLCDGNNGKKVDGLSIPDLRSRFIVGAGEGASLAYIIKV